MRCLSGFPFMSLLRITGAALRLQVKTASHSAWWASKFRGSCLEMANSLWVAVACNRIISAWCYIANTGHLKTKSPDLAKGNIDTQLGTLTPSWTIDSSLAVGWRGALPSGICLTTRSLNSLGDTQSHERRMGGWRVERGDQEGRGRWWTGVGMHKTGLWGGCHQRTLYTHMKMAQWILFYA